MFKGLKDNERVSFGPSEPFGVNGDIKEVIVAAGGLPPS